MKKKELLRVAQLCLPKLQLTTNSSGTTSADGTTITLHDESDLQVSTICSLWSGMGHIYKVTLQLPAAAGPIEFVVKHVAAPRKQQQSLGDRRKA